MHIRNKTIQGEKIILKIASPSICIVPVTTKTTYNIKSINAIKNINDNHLSPVEI